MVSTANVASDFRRKALIGGFDHHKLTDQAGRKSFPHQSTKRFLQKGRAVSNCAVQTNHYLLAFLKGGHKHIVSEPLT